MADLNELMRIAEEKAALKAAKASSRSKEQPKKKVVKGIRPYMDEKAIAEKNDSITEADKKFLEEAVIQKPVEAKEEAVAPIKEFKIETHIAPAPIKEAIPEVIAKAKESKVQKFDKIVTSSNKVEIHQEEKSFEYLEKGYTKFPNETLQRMIEGDLTKREMQLVLILMRLSSGFGGKQWAKVSNARLSEITGIATNHISLDMKSLVEKGFVEKSVSDNRSDANSYRVKYDHKVAYMEAGYDETTLPHDLRTYLDGLIKSQRDGEKKAIFELLEEKIEPEVLYAAIRRLKKEGLGGQKVPNPAAYLKKAGSDIFYEVRKQIEARSSHLQSSSNFSAEDLENERITKEIQQKFENSFSNHDERNQKLEEIIQKYNLLKSPSGGISIPYFVAEKLAVRKWADEQGLF